MKIKELREKSEVELKVELDKLVKEFHNIKFKKVIGVIDNPLKVRIIKKDIARIKTLLHEKEIAKILTELEKKSIGR
jgi:large subunit ribosomal protein L29